MISEGQNFTLGQEAWLQALRIYGEKFYYSKKGIEKASDIDITRGQRVAHPLGGSGFIYIFSSVQSLSHVRLLATTWTAVCQASLSITNSRSVLKLMSIELVMPLNHLILIPSTPAFSLSHSVVFLYFFALIIRKAFLALLAILWNSTFRWVYLSFSPLPFSSFLTYL